jgi:hypothetical protein
MVLWVVDPVPAQKREGGMEGGRGREKKVEGRVEQLRRL